VRLNQLDGLLAFWKVAEQRGFSAAAAALEVSPSALSQAIRRLESRLGVRLLNRTTRSVSLTEAGEAYLSRISPALGDVMLAGEQLHALQGRPSGVLRINSARVAITMVLQPLLAGFLEAHPDVQIELSNDEGYIDIVERGFDAGVRLGESVQKDMVGVPLSGPLSMAIVGSPDYFKRHPAPKHPSELVHHDCVRFRFQGSGAIYKWELNVDGRLVAIELQSISDQSRRAVEAGSDVGEEALHARIDQRRRDDAALGELVALHGDSARHRLARLLAIGVLREARPLLGELPGSRGILERVRYS